MLPPPPPEIEGMPLAIEYTSSLGIAQRSVGLASLVQYGMTQAELFRATQDPAVLMRTNWSELAQAIGDRSGLPPKVQRSDDEVQEMLDAQAQAVAAQQQAEQRALEAKTVRDLGAAPMGEDTALTRVTESGAFGAAR
jgi:hypothetical protein